MTRSFVILLAAAGMLTGASPGAAHGRQTTSPTVATVAAPKASPLSKRPFARVFTQQPPAGSMPLWLRAPLPSTQPTKTCGMIVLPADPTIDPKFERPPADTRTRFSMRTIPWLCR
jgi:hypothetical protein